MGLSKFRLYKYCKTARGWRYCRAVIAVNGKIRSNAVLVDGKEEVHEEGRYFFNINGQWVPAGDTSTEAYRSQTRRLAKQRYKRDTGEEFPEPDRSPRPQEPQAKREPFEDAIRGYLAELEVQVAARSRRPRTLAASRQALTEFAEQSGVKYVNDITAQTITRHIAWVVQNSPTHSAKTANNKFVQILAFLKHFGAVPTVGSGKSSRLLGMKDAPRCVEKEVKIYTEEQLTKFFFACDARETAIFQTFRRAGLREQELATLRTQIACLTGRLRASGLWSGPSMTMFRSGTPPRDVNIDPQLASILKAWLKTHDHALVFPNPRGKVDGHILRLCQQIARRAGLNPDDFWLHRFRSSYATHLLRYGPAIGLTLEDIRKQLGHRDVESLRRYIKALEGEERGKKVAQVFADIQVTAPARQTAVV